jgi:hypothetical protein
MIIKVTIKLIYPLLTLRSRGNYFHALNANLKQPLAKFISNHQPRLNSLNQSMDALIEKVSGVFNRGTKRQAITNNTDNIAKRPTRAAKTKGIDNLASQVESYPFRRSIDSICSIDNLSSRVDPPLSS